MGTCFYEVKLQNKFLPLVMGSNVILIKIFVENDREKKQHSRDIRDPINS